MKERKPVPLNEKLQRLENKSRKYEAKSMPSGGGHGPGGPRSRMEKPKVKNAKGTIIRLFKYLSAVKLPLILALLALMGSTIASLVTPMVSGKLIDTLNSATGIPKSVATASMLGAYVATGYMMNKRLGKKEENPEEGKTNLLAEGFIFTFSGFLTSLAAGTGAVLFVKDGEAMNVLLGQLGLMALLYVVSSLFSLSQQLMLVKVAQHTVRIIREELFEKLQALPLRYFDSVPHGQIMSRLTNDVDNVSNMLSNTITQILSSVVTLVVCLYMMLTLSWQLTLVSFITIPFSMLIMGSITKRTRKYFKLQQACLGELNGIVEETVSGARVVKVFSREEKVIQEFEEANEDLTTAGTYATILSSVIGPMMNVVHNISFALMSGIGGFLVVNGNVSSIGMIQSFLQYSRQFSNPFNQIANQITTIQSALAGAERVFEVMDIEPEPTDHENADPLCAPKGHVVFEDVTFGYSSDRPILKNLTFDAKPGQTIALVGPTGAGKTTVVNLLMRFYDIDSGKILIDGVPIAQIQREKLRTSLGMVLQDVYLFAGTVRENIAYGNLDATDEAVERAAKMANCHEFITRLPKGYQTELSEAGSNISQGQRQLLSIARAILSDPAILILDEATSSVDTRTEMNIQQAMIALMKGRTSFVIAHRLSTIRNADQILVLNAGTIIESGTHEELLEKGGFYANLLNSQYKSGVLEESDT
ncbi:MAG: ABC transporter ATP-binding protein [Clostridia bacterium]|nr:ABC transporter ATP-binding protein [Clostridia bacterium]